MNKGRKMLSVIVTAALVGGAAVPVTVISAAEEASVRVIVENNTYRTEDGAPWEGVLVDQWLPMESDDTAVTLIEKVLQQKGYEADITDSSYGAYINGIHGLTSGDGSQLADSMYPGWMFGVNDWYGNNGVSSFAAADGTLSDGDVICVCYSRNMGVDIGSDYSDSDTSLKELTASEGQLKPEFSPEQKDYQLILPEGTDTISLTTSVSNKYYCSRIYQGSYTPDQPSQLRSGSDFSVRSGDVIYIGVADSQWQYLSDGTEKSLYTVTVSYQETDPVKPDPTSKPTEESNNPQPEDQSYDYEKALQEITEKITSQSDYARAGNEWTMLTLARLHKLPEADREAYLADLHQQLTTDSSAKATDTARYVIAMTALGSNAEDFDGKDLTAPFGSFEYVSRQGINGVIFSLIALDTHGYSLIAPDNADSTPATKEMMIDALLSAELPDGGWTFYGDVAEPDLTGMVMTALAPYYDQNSKVKDAIDRALSLLSQVQNEDGTFSSWGAANSECSAQVTVALSALGIDAAQDERFVKKGGSVLDGLMSYYLPEDQGFAHVRGEGNNAVATTQAYYALCAYQRWKQGETALYDMSDLPLAAYIPKTPAEEQTSLDESSVPAKSDQETTDDPQRASSPTVPTGDTSVVMLLTAVVLISAAWILLAAYRERHSIDRSGK